MIRSMTGYGRAREVIGEKDITVEIKAVNHRYFEAYIKIPRTYMQIEDMIRNDLQKKINRGKLEVAINIDSKSLEIKSLKLNEALLKEYIELFTKTEKEYSLKFDMTASSLLKLPEVLTMDKEEPDMQQIWDAIKPVLDSALNMFIMQREKEGTFLAKDIITKCDYICADIDLIKSRAGELVPLQIEKLKNRITQLLDDIKVDEQRFLTELAIMADKMSIDEELVRLASHTVNLKEIFKTGLDKSVKTAPSGKKIDFIIQEMNREINTITSKIGDIDLTMRAIEVKSNIEKIREQIQNIE